MNNQATIPTTTANSNILVTLTSPSTITTTAIASASGMVTISVAAKGQDANFETRSNAMENAIFKFGSTFEKFISTNNLTGWSRGENDSGYLTDV